VERKQTLLRKATLKQKAAPALAEKAALVVELPVDRPSWIEQETGVWLPGK